MKGYKAFNSDLTCLDFQYEVGKIYTTEGELEICKNGFHFCDTVADCFDYYPCDGATRIAEVESLGQIVSRDNKHCTDKIKIIRELSLDEQVEALGWKNKIGLLFFKTCIITEATLNQENIYYTGIHVGTLFWCLTYYISGCDYNISCWYSSQKEVVELNFGDNFQTIHFTSNDKQNKLILKKLSAKLDDSFEKTIIKNLMEIF